MKYKRPYRPTKPHKRGNNRVKHSLHTIRQDLDPFGTYMNAVAQVEYINQRQIEVIK